MYVAKEATQSSRIEGTQTQIEDASRAAKDLAPEVRDDWQEVQNYIQAINFAIAQLDTLPLSNRLLREAHAILMQGVRGQTKQPGAFRTGQNWIGVNLKLAAIVPPHQDHVPGLMADLEMFLHNRAIHVPPLVRIAIAHYQFETIHPFLDGNGRLGRLLIGLYLASEGLLVRPALYLSDYFERNKTAYVDHLMAVRDGNHMRAWLMFFLYGVEETARRSIATFQAILALKERIERDVIPRLGHRRLGKALSLIQALYRQPVLDIAQAASMLATATNTAAVLVEDFVAAGVLHEVTGQKRGRVFLFKDYIELFSNRPL
jgi:Fic family protein